MSENLLLFVAIHEQLAASLQSSSFQTFWLCVIKIKHFGKKAADAFLTSRADTNKLIGFFFNFQ